ncbi:pentatricopeptide repeat-containing protein, putative [Ricinus communis]|uniref:Pentatricopeptide repeat-containing protein, putative n=1 Tax=Ricinus communis TaxID=3988 RepID=B9S4A9_RICCO|nr:pentatricopeptide repeat-containing protein, putative [Ricinus communis]|eukprot:XP_002520828.1 pentatricopeptide repeat-containing protein At1g09410, mitochondrial [Ricinus communis]
MSGSRLYRRLLNFPATFQSLRHLNRSFSSLKTPNPSKITTRIPFPVFASDTYESNVKISNLGLRGKVKEARKVFDEMPRRDAVSYASMITVYLKNKDLPQAEILFREIPERNVVADSAMISGYVRAGRLDKARQVFDQMVERNVFSWTSLVSGYFKIGNVDEAMRLFNQMPEKNVVSWTTAVVGYAQNGFIDEARDIFNQMPEKNIIAWTAMVKSYVENDEIDEAFELFYQMPQRNLYSWNIMISGCINANRLNEAIQLFNSMPQRNEVSWTTLVTGLARNGMMELARKYFDHMPTKDIAAWNAMITAYVDQGSMAEASNLFNLMPEKNIVSWNALIDGYARNGPESNSLRYLILMLRSNFKPNETTITSVLTACDSILELMQAHGLVIHLGFEQDKVLANGLVTTYSRCGDVLSARFIFDQLEIKDIVSWTAMILAYSNHGCGPHALQVFARMLRSGAKPDGITFVGLLSACSHAGLVKKGQMLFDSMSCAYGVEPRAEHYSCLVDILGRAGEMNKAMKVVSEMPPHECDGAVLGALLGACRLHKDVGLANHIGEKLIEKEPTSSGSYVLLANAYAACGKWNEFAEVRKEMKERNVKKEPGFSQIEVKGKSHVFFVRDRSHPQLEEIYLFLDEKLLPLMREMGYTPESSPAPLPA